MVTHAPPGEKVLAMLLEKPERETVAVMMGNSSKEGEQEQPQRKMHTKAVGDCGVAKKKKKEGK